MTAKPTSTNNDQQQDLSDRLATLSPEQLRLLFDRLLDQKPELEDWFTVMVDSLATPPPADASTKKQRQTNVDVDAFRRQIDQAIGLLDYRHHWETIWNMVHGLESVHAQAVAFLRSGDFYTALVLMRALGNEVIPQYPELEEECQVADFLDSWGDDMTEAILGADLSPEEREELSRQIDKWAATLVDYGFDDTLDKLTTACNQDEDQPADGNVAADLLEAKLNVLAYGDNTEDYLRFCLAHQAHCRYARRLIDMGQGEQAIKHALEHTMTVDEHLELAHAFLDKGHAEEAYQVGLKGLSGEGNKYLLGSWLAALAEDLGHLDVARQAWMAAFADMPRLEAYQNLKRLAGDEWAKLRPDLIARLRQESYSSVLVEALIDDQEVDEAIKAWGEKPYGGYMLLEKLVDAAAATHPDWAAEQAMKEAERLINKASKYYPHAVTWLGKVKAIYIRHNRPDDWRAYLSQIREKYGRRYSLMGQIDSDLR
ncbi:MAG: hypothetical protein JXB07_22245 [Anaerolineae bacterium]|nr:hypothetical protein [Anaerolineae bacterium]